MKFFRRVLFIICLASSTILLAWNFAPAQKAGGVAALNKGEMQVEKSGSQQVAATIIRTIVYRQVSSFQSGSGPSIERMKMSADGSKIVFSNGAKKIFKENYLEKTALEQSLIQKIRHVLTTC